MYRKTRIVCSILILVLITNSLVFSNDRKYTDKQIVAMCKNELQYQLDKGEFDLFGKKTGEIMSKYAKMYGVGENTFYSIYRSLKWDKEMWKMQLRVADNTIEDNFVIYVSIGILVGVMVGGVRFTSHSIKHNKSVARYNRLVDKQLKHKYGNLSDILARDDMYRKKITFKNFIDSLKGEPTVINKNDLPELLQQYNKIYPVKTPKSGSYLELLGKAIKKALR